MPMMMMQPQQHGGLVTDLNITLCMCKRNHAFKKNKDWSHRKQIFLPYSLYLLTNFGSICYLLTLVITSQLSLLNISICWERVTRWNYKLHKQISRTSCWGFISSFCTCATDSVYEFWTSDHRVYRYLHKATFYSTCVISLQSAWIFC